MISNFLLSISRNLLRHWRLNSINITGFSIGIASCLIIGSYVMQEHRYDKHHTNYERIYRVCLDRIYPERNVLWAPIAPGVRDGLLESNQVADATRIAAIPVNFIMDDDQTLQEQAFYTDSSFFNIFSINTIAGNIKKSINDPSSIIITDKIAKKYFPDKTALGQIFKIENQGEFKVGAVIENCPQLSHLQYDVILSIHANHRPDQLTIWGSSFGYYTYILVDEKESAGSIEHSYFPKMADKYLGGEDNAYAQWKAAGNNYHYFLQPLADIHLHSDLRWEMNPNGNYIYVNLFFWVGIMILIIACINFTNLSSARFSTRLKEVGIRKVMGSFRGQIIMQFLLESQILSFVSMAIALVMVQLLIPYINLLTGSQISFFNYSIFSTASSILIFTIGVGLIAGIYPAIILSAFKPAAVLNSNSSSSNIQSKFRDYLVVAQFVISFFLIAGTFVIYKQISFFRSKELGFTKEHLLVIDKAFHIQNKEGFKEALLDNPRIASVSFAGDIPGRMQGAATYQKKGESSIEVNMTMMHGDVDLLQTWNLSLTEGRDFVFTDFNKDERNVILNETAAKQLGLREPFVGSELLDQQKNILTVVGIVKDFHTESLHKEIRPLILFAATHWLNTVSVKIKSSEHHQQVMDQIRTLWTKFVPHRTLEVFFLDDFYNSLYVTEEVIGKLSILFSALAIFLASLGLYGLSAFAAEQKTKEIGIRKVLGASRWGIVRLFLRKTNKLVILSIAIAIPITHYLSTQWLEGFAYRTSVDIATYVFSAALLLLIAIGTVLLHSYKAATLNPADTLKAQ